MSSDNASKYLRKLVAEGTSPTSGDAAQHVQRAAKEGISFTAEEWASAIRAHAENEGDGDALSDDDLAKIAGGTGGGGKPNVMGSGPATCPYS